MVDSDVVRSSSMRHFECDARILTLMMHPFGHSVNNIPAPNYTAVAPCKVVLMLMGHCILIDFIESNDVLLGQLWTALSS